MRYGILQFDTPEPDISRKILHVDMDAFYASVELLDRPDLVGKPVVIAKHPHLTGGRGIVTTCNYEARKYGIHSAMPSIEAYRLCPQAEFISTNFDKYKRMSQAIHAIFKRYTDVIEPLSLDEAYLDVTHDKQNINSATLIAQRIQADIYRELSLTASVGVSYNKFIAKIASDYQKPNGLTVIEPKDAVSFLMNLPIEDFYGVGRKSVPRFHELGIYTGHDLYQQSLEALIEHFGKMGYSLYFKVRGIHNSPVNEMRERKSIGKERTFGNRLHLEHEVINILEQLTQQVMERLNQHNMLAFTITLKIRYDDFSTITRQIKAEEPFNTYDEAIEYVMNLWRAHGRLEQSVRLLGVSVTDFDEYSFVTLPLSKD